MKLEQLRGNLPENVLRPTEPSRLPFRMKLRGAFCVAAVFVLCLEMLYGVRIQAASIGASIGDEGSESAASGAAADVGVAPLLVAPKKQSIPKIKIAEAVGWAADAKPAVASGFEVTVFAENLTHPRWLYLLPNGDVLVAETNAPAGRTDRKGLRGWFMGRAMKRAGAAVPSPDRIMLLRDADRDGNAEVRSEFLSGLRSPFGMALVGNELFVANTDGIVKFSYMPGDLRIKNAGVPVAELPAGSLNHHWTKNILASEDGKKLYATVGSNSNVAEHGMENEIRRAAILEIDRATGAVRVFASGLRNPNGMDWHPVTHALWTVVNERDEIGDLLVPDYLTSVQEGAFYGWPYSYYGPHVDERVQPQDPTLVAKAIAPDFALGSHTASLGLAFYKVDSRASAHFPEHYRNGAFIGQHGSWNRSEFAGYKVVFVPFDTKGRPAGPMEDFLTGFLDDQGRAKGRPVGVAVDRSGAVLVADDVGNRIWRVTPNSTKL